MTDDWHPKHNPWLIALTVTLATFMEVLDTSIANVSLPHIAGNLSAGVDESTWVLTSYLVANAIILPLSAYFASLLGRKNYYMLSVLLFTISSLLSGFAPCSRGGSWCFRIMQGFGGGGLQPERTGDSRRHVPARKIGHGDGGVRRRRRDGAQSSGPHSADGSRTISAGVGSSSLIFRWGSSRFI